MNYLKMLAEGQSLSAEESFDAINSYLNDPVQMGAFLSLLHAKGETESELLGLVQAFRQKANKITLDTPTLDIVGTGGDQAGTVNISTGAALLAAQCGVPILKTGNRASSSRCGSADVLEEMGYDIHMSKTELKEALRKRGFGFCFAPDFHPALNLVHPIRKALNIPTAFNLIGPLLSSAGTDYMLIGVYKPELVPILANILYKLGTKRSLIFSGCGIDELSCIGPTDAILVTEVGLAPFTIDPEALGFKKCALEDLQGGDAKTNAKLLKNPNQAIRDTLILNAAVALFLYGRVKSLSEGVQIAKRKSLKNSKGIIAEIKRASPSKGKIGEIPDPAERAQFYESAGASMISVLTSSRFDGNLSDLEAVKRAVSTPVLRKDFVSSKEQLLEAEADFVLLIVADLKEMTKEMLDETHRLGMEAIVEVHTEEELKIAITAGAEFVGVNQRNLKDFTMHPEVYKLVEKIPDHIVKIAESGVQNLEDAKRLFNMGYDLLLVGEALTRNPPFCEELCSLKSVV